MPKMTLTCSIAVVVAILAMTCGPVDADCCYKTSDCCCRDGTAGTPYCGVSECNIFGCNCSGGCRQGSRAARSLINATGPNAKVQKFLDSIPIEKTVGWELSYLVAETMNLISQEGF